MLLAMLVFMLLLPSGGEDTDSLTAGELERKKLMEIKQQLNKFGAPPQSIWLAFHEILLHMEDKLENLDSISKTAVKNFVF